ncbi:YdcF family protein [Bacillus pumilus]|uniref:YdcF family protein n=1 Tax=Bacillus pumilus TaxID=1408 RepID=UPI0011A3F833|nr:YdcF family protein [Bacillus pumilus]
MDIWLILFLWFLFIISVIGLILSILYDRRNMINGFLVITSIGLFPFSLISLLGKVPIIPNLGAFLLVIIMVFYSSFLWWFIPLFLYNGVKIRKLEGKRFTNSLTLIALVSLILYIICIQILNNYQYIREIGFISIGITLIYAYFIVHITVFINTYLLQKLPIIERPDFIIVLGSGLINDKVPPLLASRIDKAIEIRNKYENNESIKIIFSGGQGEDESLPEGKAMANYAKQKGLNDNVIIEETRSKTTEENILYSKDIMSRLSKNYKAVLVSNNFHILRASLIAKEMGLKIYGYGSKTKLYFWINAFIREYVAILSMKKRQHSLIIGIVMFLTILAILISVIARVVY